MDDSGEPSLRLKKALKPWHESLLNPEQAQSNVLEGLLKIYTQTTYGMKYAAGSVSSIEDYRRAFPVMDYQAYKPLVDIVMSGNIRMLLNDDPVGWAITRGTTRNETKFIPMTPDDLSRRVSAGRAVMNFAVDSGQYELFSGVNLNLNFPSRVGKVKVGEAELEYGYSSGIYTRYVSMNTPVRSVPHQDDIDALGGGKTIRDWEARFDLAYEQCKSLNVTLVGGVAPTAIEFGRYLKKKYHKYPRDIWQVQILTLGSTPGINTRLEPLLHALYGNAAIREIYGATEGMFGQQLDEKRAWTPNYDLFFFEIETKHGIKMLHEMSPGETGSLIVSTPVFARYKIGDMILSIRQPYFRCIGREKWWTPWNYAWNEFLSLNFGRL